MKRKRSLFLRYVMTYMTVCIVTIAVFAVFLYTTNVQAAQKAIGDEYRAALERAGGMLDDRLGSLYELSVVLQARDATEAIRRLGSPIQAPDIPAINAYSRELQPYNYTNMFLRELILFFSKSGIFISSNSIGLYPQVYYDVVLRYKDIAFPQWRERIRTPQFMNYHRYTDERTGERFLDIMLDLPPDYGADDKVLLIARIGAPEILNGLEGAMADGAIVVLRDWDGRLVFLSDPAFPAGPLPPTDAGETAPQAGAKYVAFAQTLSNVKWQYTLLVPRNVFLAEEQQFIRTLAILTLSVLLTGVLMSVLLSLWGLMPIRRLLRVFRPADQGAPLPEGNEYVNLDAHIRSLIKNNQSLQFEVRRYQELNRANFLDRLLGSGFSSTEELMAIAQHSGIVMEYRKYVLAVFELMGYNNELRSEFLQEMDMATIAITDFLDKRVNLGIFVHKTDFSHIALIFCLDMPGQISSIHGEVTALKAAVSEKLNLQLRCAISEDLEDPNSLGLLYFSLYRQLQETEALPGEPVQFIRNRNILNESYYYPIAMETKLLNYLLAGNEREASGLLSLLFEENMEKNKLAMPSATFLLYAVKGTLIRARDEIKELDGEADAQLHRIIYLHNGLEPKAQWTRLLEAVSLLCEAVCHKKNQRNTNLIQRINRCIETNYQNSQLDLTMIAQEFMLTSSYLSYFYKGITGESIPGTIEKTRMEQAERLLREGGRTVKDISTLVGYTNLNTFYKAFRRFYGISPKGYYDQIHQA